MAPALKRVDNRDRSRAQLNNASTLSGCARQPHRTASSGGRRKKGGGQRSLPGTAYRLATTVIGRGQCPAAKSPHLNRYALRRDHPTTTAVTTTTTTNHRHHLGVATGSVAQV